MRMISNVSIKLEISRSFRRTSRHLIPCRIHPLVQEVDNCRSLISLVQLQFHPIHPKIRHRNFLGFSIQL